MSAYCRRTRDVYRQFMDRSAFYAEKNQAELNQQVEGSRLAELNLLDSLDPDIYPLYICFGAAATEWRRWLASDFKHTLAWKIIKGATSLVVLVTVALLVLLLAKSYLFCSACSACLGGTKGTDRY